MQLGILNAATHAKLHNNIIASPGKDGPSLESTCVKLAYYFPKETFLSIHWLQWFKHTSFTSKWYTREQCLAISQASVAMWPFLDGLIRYHLKLGSETEPLGRDDSCYPSSSRPRGS